MSYPIEITQAEIEALEVIFKANNRNFYSEGKKAVEKNSGCESINGKRVRDGEKLKIFIKRFGLTEEFKPAFGNKDPLVEIEKLKKTKAIIKKPVEVFKEEITKKL